MAEDWNPENYKNRVAQVIKSREASGTGAYYLCDVNGWLTCRPSANVPTLVRQFMRLNKADILLGLTTQQWSKLGAVLMKFYKGKEPWPKQLQRSQSPK